MVALILQFMKMSDFAKKSVLSKLNLTIQTEVNMEVEDSRVNHSFFSVAQHANDLRNQPTTNAGAPSPERSLAALCARAHRAASIARVRRLEVSLLE